MSTPRLLPLATAGFSWCAGGMASDPVPLADCYGERLRAEEMARWSRLFLVRAATFVFITHSAVARELGVSQPAVTKQLGATKLAHVQGLDRAVLLGACPPAVQWLATSFGFGSIEMRERCWYPQPAPSDATPAHATRSEDAAESDHEAAQRARVAEAFAWMFGESLVEPVNEPPLDVLVTVPIGLGHNEINQLSSVLQRLLRRDVIIHPVAG